MNDSATLCFFKIFGEQLMVAHEREQLWQARVTGWQASGMSQQAFATEHGLPVHQVGYWVRRLTKSQAAPALMPVKVARSVVPMTGTINVHSERGWMISLPSDVSAVWLTELLRAL